MRSFISRITLVAAIAAVSVSAIATACASELPEVNGMVKAVPVAANTADKKKQEADAKAAWKVSKAQTAQPVKAVAAAQPFNLKVTNGELLVDGVARKVKLNYNIQGATQLYFYLPGTGTVILTSVAAPGAVVATDAIHGNVLEFTAAGHNFRLTSQEQMIAVHTADAYIRVDKSESARSQGDYLLMGYAVMMQAPYTSTGAEAQVNTSQAAVDEPTLTAAK